MKKIVPVACAASAIIGVLFALPDSVIRMAPSQTPLLDGARVPANVASLIERSCQNCHSLKTQWPVYSRIFPLSSLIESDVANARSHMNLSRWQSYDSAEKSALLAEIGSVVRNRIMPPRRYTLVHPAAKLSAADADEIYRWTRAARRVLESTAEQPAE